ncbi:MAG: deoxyribonuclease IV [Candidatus Lokiarchaeota archaeon]|nr:deoxyribonuclease IV [Candidatus Lokiarchaeota archaeon]
MSIAGSIEKCFERGEIATCDSIQIFTKSNRQWNAKPLTDEEIDKFKNMSKKSKIKPVFAHDTYLINLASPEKELNEKSYQAFLMEVKRAEQLGLTYIVMHPGSYMDSTLKDGIIKIAVNLVNILKETEDFKVRILLENMAGQGTNIGAKFDHLQKIVHLVERKTSISERLGYCYDTCHGFGAGYDIRTQESYEKTMEEFDHVLGIENLCAFHINDSKNPLGSKKDRHEHIGQGKIGKKGFKWIINDKRFKNHPGVLETPKGKDMAEDIENLKVLRSLIE